MNLLMNRAKVGVFRAVSVRCLVTLLNAVPHFNLTEKLIASIIPRMDSDDTAIRFGLLPLSEDGISLCPWLNPFL